MKPIPPRNQTPNRVLWSEIEEFDDLDERVSAVTVLFGSVIGVNEGYIGWCPDDDPPTEQERFAWLWAGRPSLHALLRKHAKGDLLRLMDAYKAREMESWWREITTKHGAT